jgi:hypothetical protein
MAGHTLQNRFLETLGRFSGAAPLPWAFGNYRGVEFWTVNFHVAVTFQDGTREVLNLGQHRDTRKQKATHIVTFAISFPLVKSLVDQGDGSYPLYYGICRDGFMAREWG